MGGREGRAFFQADRITVLQHSGRAFDLGVSGVQERGGAVREKPGRAQQRQQVRLRRAHQGHFRRTQAGQPRPGDLHQPYPQRPAHHAPTDPHPANGGPAVPVGGGPLGPGCPRVLRPEVQRGEEGGQHRTQLIRQGQGGRVSPLQQQAQGVGIRGTCGQEGGSREVVGRQLGQASPSVPLAHPPGDAPAGQPLVRLSSGHAGGQTGQRRERHAVQAGGKGRRHRLSLRATPNGCLRLRVRQSGA